MKHHAKISACRFLDQAEADVRGDAVPFVLMREDGDTDWVVMVRAKNLVRLSNELNRPDSIIEPDSMR